MRQTGWTRVLAICILMGTARLAESQKAPEPSSRSTMAGVYSVPQARLGGDVYALACRSCHAPESHAGPVFKSSWGGRLLSELVQYVRENMPKNEPGSLTADEYAQVTAYLLKLNGMPAGDEDLSTDLVALTKIRIETGKGH